MNYKSQIIRTAGLKSLTEKLVGLIGEDKVVQLVKTFVDEAWKNTKEASLQKESAGTFMEERRKKEQRIRDRFRDEHWIRNILDKIGAPGMLLSLITVFIMSFAGVPLSFDSKESMLLSILNILGISAAAASSVGAKDFDRQEQKAVERGLSSKYDPEDEEDVLKWQ